MDQPYRAFVKEMLEVQRFPEIRPASGEDIIPPYDVTGWTLPLLMGVDGAWLDVPLEAELERVESAPYPDGGVTGEGRVFLLGRETNAAARAVNQLLAGKARVQVATEAFQAAGSEWPAGSYLIRKAGGDLSSIAAETRVTFHAIDAAPEVAARSLHRPRVGLYKPWTASMDEGWTRLVLERFDFAFESLDPKAVQAGNLARKYDAIILPDQPADLLAEGRYRPRPGEPPRYSPPRPPEYRGGLGEEGIQALERFVHEGGTLVTLDSAGALPLARMNLPVRDTLKGVPSSEFLCPGSLLRILVDPSHPLGYGMPDEVAGYFSRGPAYSTSIPGADRTRQVVARYPSEGPVLLSGWIRGEDRLRRQAAVVDVGAGKGRVVLLGFPVQHRAQPHGTFRFLFNALERAAWEERS
jgi:hypothetical protein